MEVHQLTRAKTSKSDEVHRRSATVLASEIVQTLHMPQAHVFCDDRVDRYAIDRAIVNGEVARPVEGGYTDARPGVIVNA